LSGTGIDLQRASSCVMSRLGEPWPPTLRDLNYRQRRVLLAFVFSGPGKGYANGWLLFETIEGL
jgi:hypothetical protein